MMEQMIASWSMLMVHGLMVAGPCLELELAKLSGEENETTLRAANNFALSLVDLQRFKEAKKLLRKVMPISRRVLGESHRLTLKMRKMYGWALYENPGATLDDLRAAVTTLEDTERTARRVLGGAHPLTKGMEAELPRARAALRAREPKK